MARILIVDDEDNVRFTLVKALKSLNHEIYQASDGNAALAILANQEIDLVITDIFMPNREGLETILEIRMNWPKVKLVAMSGGGRIRNAEFLEIAEKFGADLVLKKPFAMSEFRAEIGKLLDDPLWQSE